MELTTNKRTSPLGSFAIRFGAIALMAFAQLGYADNQNTRDAAKSGQTAGSISLNDAISNAVKVAVNRQSDKPGDDTNPSIPVRGLTSKALTVTYIDVKNNVILPGAKRLGMNLGARDSYGSAQIIKNLITNPGFEAGEYGELLHVDDGSTSNSIRQCFWDTTWNVDKWGIGQPEGFWNGGTYEVLYGPAKGRKGTITSFVHSADNKNVFNLDTTGTNFNTWDVICARKDLPGIVGWPGMQTDIIDTTTTRPGSPGKQSLKLLWQGESWMPSYCYYMDSFWRDSDRTSGKQIIIEGPYKLGFWAKGATNGMQLRVEFRRESENAFFDQTVNLTTAWQYFEFNKDIPVGTDSRRAYTVDEYHGLLAIKMFINNASGAWVDDIYLGPSNQTNPTVFMDPLVNKLKELRPGVLRDWGNQLGSSLDNQIAEPYARKTVGWRPHECKAGNFSYSLHEFLELCKEIGSEPWYVIPPTFTEQEMINLSEYLCAPADGQHPYADKRAALGQIAPWSSVFPMIHLEWGNEMWGSASGSDPFFGASAFGGARLAAMAHDRFGAMRQYGPNFDANKFDLVIGGQVGWPGRQKEIEQNGSNHDSVALAPYFGSLTNTWNNDDEMFGPLFAKPMYESALGNMRQSKTNLDSVPNGTRLNIYEINFHTTGTETPVDVRNDFVTSMGGGVAMPLFMLNYMKNFGAREQCAFQAVQYSFSSGGYVRIWGCLRDINVTGRKRPTWLGMETVNKAIQGDMLETVHSGIKSSWTQSAINAIGTPTTVDHVQSFAFRDGQKYGIVVFNLNLTTAQRVRIATPTKPTATATEYILSAASPRVNNEDAENIAIKTNTINRFRQTYYTTLAPCSVYVLTWNSAV